MLGGEQGIFLYLATRWYYAYYHNTQQHIEGEPLSEIMYKACLHKLYIVHTYIVHTYIVVIIAMIIIIFGHGI